MQENWKKPEGTKNTGIPVKTRKPATLIKIITIYIAPLPLGAQGRYAMPCHIYLFMLECNFGAIIIKEQ